MGIFEKDDGLVESQQPVIHDYEKEHLDVDDDVTRFEAEGGATEPEPEPESGNVVIRLSNSFIGNYRDSQSGLRFRRGEAKEVDAETAERLLAVLDRNGRSQIFVRVTD